MDDNLTLQAIEQLRSYHKFFALLLAGIYLMDFGILWTQKNYATLNKRLWFFMPLIFCLLAIIFLLGISLWAMMGFVFEGRIFEMCAVWVVFLSLEIMRSKILKRSRISLAGMKKYVRFCKIYYGCGFGIFVVLFMLWSR
ncbi:hypothetical protein [Helicobacter mustelae]|uniref:Putative inner membrane protein n=1 Tax=Helicobacter mustelae (strain ATCC 43772 / CCUG 25715 / CIP 103759 / LMG 18044 / NCTC 12198 / R85-136P) TaxID=679897 RepID=D3UFX2_HELM1|nr:hypothetical protein [Helicobacter mustelae]CBG39393.1 putative inner membrane protein [Helicobacter mustelae 12198]SQH70906.1 TerC family integral membrane protein [Helicobacter mustelae]STP12033.1 TerC family integral membrane protein [Helicobacter mustelae]